MQLIADSLVALPFKLDFCAIGPDVEPISCAIGETAVTIYFPPSLAEGTDGQGIFGDWAWWTGATLRLILERDVDSVKSLDSLRTAILDDGSQALRRFLNACRVRLNRPDIHPVRIDPRSAELAVVHDDGSREILPEPVESFFYQNMPSEPPLATSLNATTLPAIAADMAVLEEADLDEHLRLDADALDARGESDRADWIRGKLGVRR